MHGLHLLIIELGGSVDVQNPHNATVYGQRDCQLGHDSGYRFAISSIGGHVLHQHGLSPRKS